MLDVFKAMAGGPRNWLLGWLLPSVVAASAVGFFILPQFPTFPLPEKALDRALVLVGSTIVLALLLSALSVQLYQVLEGYLWPTKLQQWRTARHCEIHAQLRAAADVLNPATTRSDNIEAVSGWHLETAKLLNRLYSYPADVEQIAPTRFGNVIRSFETYGYDRYLLDSQTLWDELVAVVPESLRQEESNSRAPVDFFVATFWLDLLYLVLVGATVIHGGVDGGLLVSIGLCVAILPLSYMAAIRSCAGWAQAVRAIVNIGRGPLAASFGLDLPQKIGEEREMWQALGWFVADSYDPDTASDLDRWRIPPKPRSQH